MSDDAFSIWLGRIGKDRSTRGEIAKRMKRAGRGLPGSRSFGGKKLGKGAAAAALLASGDRFGGRRQRRVVIKARIARLGLKGVAGARAHLRYLQRDGTTRDGEPGELYGPDTDVADGKAFLERSAGDRHQFRLIVAPEDGDQYDDLKGVVRRLMDQAQRDLGTDLDWIAVDHFNTGRPHAHIMLRGKTDLGKDLIIAPAYIGRGLRERAVEIVTLDLGTRSDREIDDVERREIGQHRFTGIDRRVLASADEIGVVRSATRDPREQSLRAGRLQTLSKLGLAREIGQGSWLLEQDIEQKLRRMGERGDIIRTMQRALRDALPERGATDQTIFVAENHPTPLVGRVVTVGLSDEHTDRRYLVVDGLDGLSHYVDIGRSDDLIATDAIVAVEARPIEVRAADRIVAEVAASNDGIYSIDAHLRHDPAASEAFAEAHVRRLEALRRSVGAAERRPDGSWMIADNHLERAEEHERSAARKSPVAIRILSTRSLSELPHHDGVTWLDKEISARGAETLRGGFGSEVRRAMTARIQWLVEEGFARRFGQELRYAPDMLASLRSRELARVATRLSEEAGLRFVDGKTGGHFDGRLSCITMVGDEKFGVVENSREFTLVPWRPALDRAIGKRISGTIGAGGIEWTIGHDRGPAR